MKITKAAMRKAAKVYEKDSDTRSQEIASHVDSALVDANGDYLATVCPAEAFIAGAEWALNQIKEDA